MDGRLSIEKREDGLTFIIFAVNRKEDVDGLTLDMIDMGLDALYEPGCRSGRYESCVICNEKTGIKMVAEMTSHQK